MADIVKSYFLPPRWKYGSDGPIFLGSIITNPATPQLSLNPAEKTMTRVLTLEDEQDNFSAIIGAGKDVSTGISASLLSAFGLGANLSRKNSSHTRYQLKATTVRTQEFYPTPSFVRSAMGNDEVQLYLAATKYKKDLYVITGLMTAMGASIATDDGKSTEISAGVTVSGAAAGVPGEIGPQFSQARETSTSASFDATRTIILGYQLSRISWVRRKKAFDTVAYQKGAMLSDNEKVDSSVEEQFCGEGLGVDHEGIGADEFDMASVPVEVSGRPSFTFVVPESVEEHEEITEP